MLPGCARGGETSYPASSHTSTSVPARPFQQKNDAGNGTVTRLVRVEFQVVSRNYDGFAKPHPSTLWFRETIKITKMELVER